MDSLYKTEIIQQGDASGNGMVVRFRLPSGLDIFGLPTKNFYGGHWDLGPTWNYVVMADPPFLVDAGRFGQGKNLIRMMEVAGIKPADLEFVLISHGHEDHDGGLAELVEATRLRIKAHTIYDLMIRKYPDKAPAGYKQDFPAKCWRCPMPESFFSKFCLGYHEVLQNLAVQTIGDGESKIQAGVRTFHLPGHSPDCLAVLLGTEAVLVGDIVLPEITPWPTSESLYDEVAGVIGTGYPEANSIFGLQCYIRSLKRLRTMARDWPELLVLPAHRLYSRDQWNPIGLGQRLDELLQHHIQRCAAILHILDSKPKTAEEIAREHFEERLLEGYGSMMAVNEVNSHCELLIESGDVTRIDGDKYASAEKNNYAQYIQDLSPPL